MKKSKSVKEEEEKITRLVRTCLCMSARCVLMPVCARQNVIVIYARSVCMYVCVCARACVCVCGCVRCSQARSYAGVRSKLRHIDRSYVLSNDE